MGLPRSISPTDRRRICDVLERWAAEARGGASSFQRLRTRAMVYVAWGSGMRLNEVCSLNLAQVLEHPERPSNIAIRTQLYVTVHQAKGGKRKGAGSSREWSSAGAVILTKRARAAVRDYLREGLERSWLQLPAVDGAALFVGMHGWQSSGHERMSRRTAQHAWRELQSHARIPRAEQYHYHCLRHDAVTRFAEACNGDVFKVAAFGRFDVRTAQRYVHGRPEAVEAFAELAAR